MSNHVTFQTYFFHLPKNEVSFMRKPICKKVASWPIEILLNNWRRKVSNECYSYISEMGARLHLTNMKTHDKATITEAEWPWYYNR